MVKRGEVWLTRLDPTVGSEIRKTRPCLVVSPDLFTHLNTFIVAPFTSGSYPSRFRVPVEFQKKPGLILVDQIRTVDRSRLIRLLGELDVKTLSATLAILRDTFEE